MNYPRIMIAATNSGAGKTTVTLGIMLALRKKGLRIQPFKAGPDYLDPMQHNAVCRRISRNLDSWLMNPAVVKELFIRNAKGADISVIEGVMGLYDGVKGEDAGSTAHLSKALRAPVILIINAASLSRSAAAIALGYKQFDRGVRIAAIILNNIGSSRHYSYIKDIIENKTGIPVLGFLPKDAGIALASRHLGLVPAKEKKTDKRAYRRLTVLAEENIDVWRLIEIARQAPKLNSHLNSPPRMGQGKVRIAVARDEAFNFYYQDNLDILKRLGARLVEFSPLKDKLLPRGVSGVYIGGGYPELYASGLSRNLSLKNEIYRQSVSGLPIYAECGGLMYLVKKLIDFKGKIFSMAGIFDCVTIMAKKRQALGYVEIKTEADNILSRRGDAFRAHAFHWSYLRGELKGARYAYKVTKNQEKAYYDGLVKDNVLASYCHLHFASHIGLARNFIKSCMAYQEK